MDDSTKDFFSKCTDEQAKLIKNIKNPSLRLITVLNFLDDGLKQMIEHEPTAICRHYTDTSSFQLIIRNKTIRLSKISNMRNDETEGEFIFTVYKNVLEKMKNEGQISKEEYESLITVKINYKHLVFKENGEYYHIPCEPFVICMSYNTDNLEMWDRYSHPKDSLTNDGVCFGIPFYHFTNRQINMNSYYNTIKPVQILYGKDKFEKIIIKNIMFMKTCLDTREMTDILSYLLSRYRIGVKPEDNGEINFENEKEVRIVVYIPIDRNYNPKIFDNMTLSHEGDKDYLYLKLPDESYFAITRSPNCSMTKSDIEKMMKESNYTCDVNNSIGLLQVSK